MNNYDYIDNDVATRRHIERSKRTEALRILSTKLDQTEEGCYQPHGDIIALLRAASDLIKQRRKELDEPSMLFPGWDNQNIHGAELITTNRIRDAAFCILGRDNPDAGIRTDLTNVAALVHYVGDIMER